MQRKQPSAVRLYPCIGPGLLRPKRLRMAMRMLSAIICFTLAAGEATAESPPSAEQLRFFESTIRPLLVDNCQKCHCPAKQFNGLRVDSRDAVIKGGDTGPAISPGQPDESLLIRAVRHTDEDL